MTFHHHFLQPLYQSHFYKDFSQLHFTLHNDACYRIAQYDKPML
nr:hypothetical protein [Enhydrobacter sp. 8BJ]